jgi:hypothetical protein
MTRSGRLRWLLAVCCSLAAAACTETLTIDDGAGAADGGHPPDDGERSDSGTVPDATMPDAGNARVDAGSSAVGPDAGSVEVDGGGESSLPVPTTRWTGNPDDCPAAPPENEALCDVAEGQVCAYYRDDPENQGQTLYNECSCQAFCGSSASELHWQCYRNIGSQRMDCPAAQPEHGSSCYGLKGYTCWYPVNVECRCPTDANDSDWRCAVEGVPDIGEPPDVDPDTRVGEMSAEQRETWCEWYTHPDPGFPPPPNLEPNAEGFYPDTGCNAAFDFLGCSLSRPTGLSREACVANLALSSCEATVRNLNDCVQSMTGFQPSPYGCARYIDAPGCAGTIVNGSAVGGDGSAGSGLPPLDAAVGDGCLIRVR